MKPIVRDGNQPSTNVRRVAYPLDENMPLPLYPFFRTLFLFLGGGGERVYLTPKSYSTEGRLPFKADV